MTNCLTLTPLLDPIESVVSIGDVPDSLTTAIDGARSGHDDTAGTFTMATVLADLTAPRWRGLNLTEVPVPKIELGPTGAVLCPGEGNAFVDAVVDLEQQ